MEWVANLLEPFGVLKKIKGSGLCKSRYLIIYLLFLIIFNYRNNKEAYLLIDGVIYDLIIIQIILSVIKLIITGPVEGLVGTIGAQGGAYATSLSILGTIFIWLRKGGKLTRDDWVSIAGLFLVGFVGFHPNITFTIVDYPDVLF